MKDYELEYFLEWFKPKMNKPIESLSRVFVSDIAGNDYLWFSEDHYYMNGDVNKFILVVHPSFYEEFKQVDKKITELLKCRK